MAVNIATTEVFYHNREIGRISAAAGFLAISLPRQELFLPWQDFAYFSARTR
jgi:hypothetical protein